jgi:uncharacterized HAD superfamily protein
LNSNRNIYVDLDDVLSETARAFTGLLERHFGKTVAFEEMTSFDLGKSFELDAEELARFMHLAHEPQVILSLEPVLGAAGALNQIIAMGYRICIITGRPPSTAEASKAWLELNRIPHHDFICVDKYGRDAMDASYGTAITLDDLSEMHFCFAVEDSWDMAMFLRQEMELPVYLLDRPWNRDVELSNPTARARLTRCADWARVVERLG